MTNTVFAVSEEATALHGRNGVDKMEEDSSNYPCCSASASGSGWSFLPPDMVRIITQKVLLASDSSSVARLCLVNLHWCGEVSKALRTLGPNRYGSIHCVAQSIKKRFLDVTSLTLTHVRRSVDDDSLSQIKSLSKLTRLDISWCHQVTDNGLAVIGKMTNLTELNLACCSSIRDTGLAALLWLRGLQKLNLRACNNLSDVGLDILGNLSSLAHLDLWGCRQVTKAGLVAFNSRRPIGALQHLNLDGCIDIDSECLEHISQNANLTYVNLSGCQVSDESMTHLTSLPRLQTLWACRCSLTDAGLAWIGCITSLTSLHLGENDGITELGLGYLGQLKDLRELDLHECRHGITDNGLVSLQPLTALTHLDISENDRIFIGVGRLCSILPSVKRFWN